MKDSTEYMREKGMLTEECNDFIIVGNFGRLNLGKLLEEYASQQISKSVTSMKADDFRARMVEIDGVRKVALFAVETDECPLCKKTMVTEIPKHTGIIPNWVKLSQEAQMKGTGLVYTGNARVDDHLVCRECEEAGKADFKCELCKRRHPTSKIKESFGEPAEFLCTDCYEAVPAKEWDTKVEELNEQHYTISWKACETTDII